MTDPAYRHAAFAKTEAVSGRSGRRSEGGPSSAAWLPDFIAGALVAVLGLSPIPFGSNRPLFWCLWAVVLASLLGVYCVVAAARGGIYPASSGRLWLPATLFILVALSMLLQLAPFGHWLGPFEFATATGERIPTNAASLTPGDTWLSFLRWSTYGALFFLTTQVATQPRRAGFLLRAIVAIAAAQAFYALVALTQLGDTILLFDKIHYRGVATGTFVNRNSLATFLGLGAVLAMALIAAGRRDAALPIGRAEQVWLCAALLILLAAIFATQSRMGSRRPSVACLPLFCCAVIECSLSGASFGWRHFRRAD